MYKFYYNGYKIKSDIDQQSAINILNLVIDFSKDYFTVFKDDKKCLVAKFHFDISSDSYIVKIPRARSIRYWERLLTIFRDGESFRQFSNFKKLILLGFNAPTPILATEKRSRGIVIDSFIIYKYIEGRLATPEDVDIIAPELIKLLNLGFTRKDPHPQNFIIASDGVYFIDFHIKRPFFFNKLRCCMEYCKFLETTPSGSRYIEQLTKSKILFSLAIILQRYLSSFRKLRRKISKKLK